MEKWRGAGFAGEGKTRTDGAFAGEDSIGEGSIGDAKGPGTRPGEGKAGGAKGAFGDGLQRRLTGLYILLMLAVFPLFTGPFGYAALTVSKFAFFAAATGLWLAALLAVFIGRLLREKGRPRRSFSLSAVQALALCYGLACCLSALLSPYGGAVLLGAGRFDGLVTQLLLCAVFLGVHRFGRLTRTHVLAFCLSVCLCCGVSLLQLGGKNPLGLFPGDLRYFDGQIRYTGEFLGTIGNVNLLSAYLCLTGPFFGAVFITGRGRGSVAALVPMAFSAFILAASRVSGGLLAFSLCALLFPPALLSSRERLLRGLGAAGALALALALAFALDFRREGVSLSPGPLLLGAGLLGLCLGAAALLSGLEPGRFPSPRRLRRFFTGLSLLLALAGLLAIWRYPGDTGTLYEFSRLMRGEISDQFGSSRILIWRSALALTGERPLLGTGPGSFALAQDILFSRLVPETGRLMKTCVDNVHNVYLGLLANTGALSLIPYLALMALAGLSWLRGRDGPGAALGCALICCWIQDFFGLGLVIVSPLMWIFWALALQNKPKETELDYDA